MLESLHCLNCGAPLGLTPGQTLAACAYCSSTLRVAAPGAPGPAVTHRGDVPPEVVDEVKRLLLLNRALPAVAYYAREAGVAEADAHAAVNALQRTLGYAPPLNGLGVGLLALYTLVGVAALGYGIFQVAAGRAGLGLVLAGLGAGWLLLNWLVLGRGLRAFWLARRGQPAEAVILKRWTIKTMRAPGERQPVELVRFALDVRPAGRTPFETEANGLVRHASRQRSQPGCRLRLRYDPADPRRVVLLGPAGD